jgi:hypothetical protein
MSIRFFSECQGWRRYRTEPLFLPNGVVPDMRLSFAGPFLAGGPESSGGATC